MSERVRVEPLGQRLRIRVGQQLIVDTANAMTVHEIGLPDRYYVSRDDVHATLQPGSGEGRCPWKGQWKHLDVQTQGKTIGSGAWTYFAPTPVCESIRDFIAFYPNKVDALEIG